MNFITKALLWFAMKAAGVSTSSFRATDSEFIKWFGNVSHSGKSVTDETMTKISAVWSCQRILSETIGALPWAIYENDKQDNAKKVDDYPLSEVLIDSPNADMTSLEFREAKVLGLCQRGNAYSFIEKTGSGNVTSLYPIPSAHAQIKRKLAGNTNLSIADGAVFFSVLDRGKWEDYPREKIWHVKGFGNGLEGLSPLGAAREAMGFALATEEFGSRFFSQGGKPSAVVTIPQKLDPDQRKEAREALQQLFGGLENAHKAVLLENGMTATAWGAMPLEEMQFVLLRGFSVLEICRFYRIPPHMVADLSRATFSNIEHLSQDFVQFTLLPYFRRFEESASKWLFKPKDRGRFFLRFNFEGLLRADSAGRAAFFNSALQNGWMNRNEVRAKENLNRVDGLDEYTVQSNMTLVDQLAAMIAAQGKTQPAQPMNEPKEFNFNMPQPTSKIDLILPEIFGDKMKYVVEHPEVKALIKRVGESEVRIESRISALIQVVEKMDEAAKARVNEIQDANDRHAEALIRATSRPRKAVFNKEGEPIGTVPVDRLDLH